MQRMVNGSNSGADCCLNSHPYFINTGASTMDCVEL